MSTAVITFVDRGNEVDINCLQDFEKETRTGGKMKLNEAQIRACRVIQVLAGKELSGMTNAQLAKAVRTSESRMVSDTRNLEHAGMIERLPNNGWRLGPQIVQLAQAHQMGIDALQHQLIELKQRYGRTS